MPIYSPMNFDFYSMMLLGMVLLRTGFLTLESSTLTYLKVAAAGYLIGLPLHAWMVWTVLRWNFDIVASSFAFSAYEVARTAVCLAHISVFLLVLRAGAFRWLAGAFAAAGQMAFTNYVMQSIICTTIFVIFGYYAKVERYQLYFLVLAIWAVELAWSAWWLKHFRFGPFEWAWRSLTYWQRQPMRLDPQPETPAEPEAATA
jgi:uncharacterized protein